ncbi:MAG: tRNA methyl transferase PRC-barrel domain-containing protein, partial [Candidatus Gracilibacteria bacterium]|nr:tRNA methyl transferase PRC-barrel domain-containing protein [Candidatus Gracilibacteria bacterium]
FLHRVTQAKLARMHFPLGEMTKKEVKVLAEKWGVINENRGKVESQDLCFIPEKTPEAFLKRQLDSKHWREGEIITNAGEVLGKHRGLPFYTIGQRKGLELGGLEMPFYVLKKDHQKNQLIVGRQEEGGNVQVELKNLSLIREDLDESKSYELRFRYHGKPTRGRVKRIGKPYADDSGQLWNATVECEESLSGATPGQFVVMYEGEYCLGGGEIV